MKTLPSILSICAIALSVACEKETSVDKTPTAEPPATVAAPPPEPATTPTPSEVAEVPPSASAAPSAAPAPSAAAVVKKGADAPAAAPADARKVKTVRGTSAGGEGFAVSIQAPSPVRSGESGTATVVLSSKDPFHCNDKYPYKMALDAPSGVSYAPQTVRGASISEKTTTLGVPFTAGAKGKGTIAGTFSFSVCTADKCLIEKRPLSVSIDID